MTSEFDRLRLETTRQTDEQSNSYDRAVRAASDDAVSALLGFGFIDDRRFSVNDRLDGLATASHFSQRRYGSLTLVKRFSVVEPQDLEKLLVWQSESNDDFAR